MSVENNIHWATGGLTGGMSYDDMTCITNWTVTGNIDMIKKSPEYLAAEEMGLQITTEQRSGQVHVNIHLPDQRARQTDYAHPQLDQFLQRVEKIRNQKTS